MTLPMTGQLGSAALGRLELGAWHPWLTQVHHDRVHSALSADGVGSGVSIAGSRSGLSSAGAQSLVRSTGIRSSISAREARGRVG